MHIVPAKAKHDRPTDSWRTKCDALLHWRHKNVFVSRLYRLEIKIIWTTGSRYYLTSLFRIHLRGPEVICCVIERRQVGDPWRLRLSKTGRLDVAVTLRSDRRYIRPCRVCHGTEITSRTWVTWIWTNQHWQCKYQRRLNTMFDSSRLKYDVKYLTITCSFYYS